MTIEQFLSYWNQHNTAITQGLVGLIILFSLFLGYRSFFGKKSEGGEVSHGSGVDTAQLEKTLQKILDNQSESRPSKAARMDEMSVHAEIPADDHGAESFTSDKETSSEEVTQLKGNLVESQKKIEALQAQLSEAKAQAQSATGGGAVAAAAPAAGGGNSAEMEAKLRDLESRLAEYEIISEDIADLSRFKEENENLKAEIEALKAGGAAPAPAPAAESPAAPIPAEPAQAAAPTPEPTPEPPVAAAEPEPTPAAEPMVAEQATASAEGADLIDDELMKEFAAAVEGQKALDKVGEKAGDGQTAADKKNDDTDKLMNDFENFVSKKS